MKTEIHPDSKVLLGEHLKKYYHGARFIDAGTFQKNHPALDLHDTFVIGCYSHVLQHEANVENVASGKVEAEIPCAPLSKKIVHDVKQFTHSLRGTWTAEASDLGWPPGMWPTRFKVNGLGNGQYFLKIGEHEGIKIYCQEFGCIEIEVWND